MLNILLSLTAIISIGALDLETFKDYHSSGSLSSSNSSLALGLVELDIGSPNHSVAVEGVAFTVARKSWLSDIRTMAARRMNVLVYSGRTLSR